MRRAEAGRKGVTHRFALSAVLLAASTSYAADNCPWLNTATVAGIVGAPVTVLVTHPQQDKADGACVFSTSASGAVVLRIEVHAMQQPASEFKAWLAQCSTPATHIRGIGNDAVECQCGKGSDVRATVLSRVREQAFLVAATGASQVATERARRAAEQVAGNLF